jgi:hypothetical protein
MAKISALPSKEIISGFYDVIDFYMRDGVAIARKWPRRTPGSFPPAQRAQWPVFADAVALWNTLSPEVRAAYTTMATGATLSARDMMIKMYINGRTILPY